MYSCEFTSKLLNSQYIFQMLCKEVEKVLKCPHTSLFSENSLSIGGKAYKKDVDT